MEDNHEQREYKQNRELSWLRFNERVLMEADDDTVPLLERLKFISIFTSNLDEFFMIRVGSLYEMSLVKEDIYDNKTGLSPARQLEMIFSAVRQLYTEKDELYLRLTSLLRGFNVCALRVEELQGSELKFIKKLFQNEIEPILSPQIVDSHHPFPHLPNKITHIGAMLKGKNCEVFGIIPKPAAVPEVIFLPGPDIRYVHTADLIFSNVERIFKSYTVLEKTVFCVTRNADIKPNDESIEIDADFRFRMKKLLHERARLAAVRLELSCGVRDAFLNYFCNKLSLSKEQVYFSTAPFNISYAASLEERIPIALKRELVYTPFSPQQPFELVYGEGIIRQVSKKELLLSYPFESIEPFLQLIREAANDSSVISIKICIYRLARRAKLVEYLCAAAENGKDVTVIIELRARFDEQNNIDWSQRLEEAGCRIIYGFEDYKIHSKVCLITKKEISGVSYITQVGTGNYNENTAAIYTDLSYITANRDIGNDVNEFFKNMSIGNLEGVYSHILVAPYSMKSNLTALIDREISKGPDGKIFFKLNSLTDLELITKLREASIAGVEIEMIVRGICCILPQVKGETENIKVTSIVGRFLEHSRIYIFGCDESEVIYISSADFMTRNMNHRVEVACPIYSASARRKIHRLIEAQRYDNVKARRMRSDGTYCAVSDGSMPVSSQEILMLEAKASSMVVRRPSKKLRSWLSRLLVVFKSHN